MTSRLNALLPAPPIRYGEKNNEIRLFGYYDKEKLRV